MTAQEELEHGDNAEATANMAQQIAVLIEDLSLGRQELEGLQAYSDRTGRTPLTPAAPVGTPLTRATATPTSGVTIQILSDPLSFMYAGSSDRVQRSRRSRDRDDNSEDRPQR